MRRRSLIFAIATILLFFFSVPIAFIMYGGAGGALGGLAIIGCLILLQLPVFMLLKRVGALPSRHRDDQESC